MSSQTWFEFPEGSRFGVATLPYGVFTRIDRRGPAGRRRIGVAVGESVLDIGAVASVLGEEFAPLLDAEVLNPFMAAGRSVWDQVRERITAWLTDPEYRPAVLAHLAPMDAVELHAPFEVADFVDFSGSEEHACTAGRILRPNQPPLPANWRHQPIAYHGRAGSVRLSGTPVVRPAGLFLAPDGETPIFAPSRKLDFEAEVGFVVGTPSEHGRPVSAADFADHVFGVCLVNDWSARDLQRYESTSLDPAPATSFATSISPWIVPLQALEHAKVPAPEQDPEPASYLRGGRDWALDISLEVRINGHVVANPPFAAMYWTPPQLLAHVTVNGAALRTGDLFASGTVSGPEPNQRGCLLELTWDGTDPVLLGDGTERSYLLDEDLVTITATAPGPGGERIHLGEVTGRISPAAE